MNASKISFGDRRPHAAVNPARPGRRASHAVGSNATDSAEPDQPLEPPLIEVEDDRAVAAADRIDADWIAERLRRAVALIDRDVVRVSVRLIDEAQMKALHSRALGQPVVTDVLSFDASPDNNTIEADVAVCVDVARRESSLRGHGVEQELLLYALHGLLHCCGYDDHDEAGSVAMHAEEDRVLSVIGVGATYTSGNSGQNP